MINMLLHLALPAPDVVTSPPVMVAGIPLSLTCNVTVVEFLVIEPYIEWLGPDGSSISSDGNPSVTTSPILNGTLSTLIVEFSSLQTSHGGQYSCYASFRIPNTSPLNNMAVTTVTVQSEFSVFLMMFCLLLFLVISIIFVMSAVLPPSVTSVVVDEPNVQGTIVHLQGTAILDQLVLVDTPVAILGKWTRQDMKTLSEFTSISVTNQSLRYTNILTFNPLRSNTLDGGVYVYKLTISPQDPTYIKPAFANDSVMLQVQQYPPLNITQTLRTGVCMIQDNASLSGSVSPLAKTAPNNNLRYTWKDPLDQDIATSSVNFVVNEGNLVIKNLAINMGTYNLRICLSVLGSGLLDHCSTANYVIISTSETTSPL